MPIASAALIDRLRDREDRLRVGEILEIALAETDYVLEVLRRRGGRRTLANIRKLQQMANQSAAGGVGEFIERIEALTRVSEREGDAPTHAESADVVRLMTIHQAKGLEFPVVVLPDLGRCPGPSHCSTTPSLRPTASPTAPSRCACSTSPSPAPKSTSSSRAPIPAAPAP